MGKVYFGGQALGHFLMFGEFEPVVVRYRKNPLSKGGERLLNTLSDRFGGFCFWRREYIEFSFAFDQSGDDPTVVFANDRIAFPVAKAGFIINDRGALINADAVRNPSPAI